MDARKVGQRSQDKVSTDGRVKVTTPLREVQLDGGSLGGRFGTRSAAQYSTGRASLIAETTGEGCLALSSVVLKNTLSRDGKDEAKEIQFASCLFDGRKARFDDGERDKKPTDARIEREAKKFPRPKDQRDGARRACQEQEQEGEERQVPSGSAGGHRGTLPTRAGTSRAFSASQGSILAAGTTGASHQSLLRVVARPPSKVHG